MTDLLLVIDKNNYNNKFVCIDTLDFGKNLLKNIVIVMNQLKMIVTASSSNNENESLLLIDDSQQLFEIPTLNPPESNTVDNNNIIIIITSIIDITTKLLINFDKSTGMIPNCEYNLVPMKYIPLLRIHNINNNFEHDLIKLIDFISELIQVFPAGRGNIDWLIPELNKFKSLLLIVNNIVDDDDNDNNDVVVSENVKNLVEKLSEKILIIIQNIYKKYNNTTNNKNPNDNDDDDELSSSLVGLEELLLNRMIVDDLANDMILLDMKKVLKIADKLAGILFEMPPDLIVKTRTIVSNCLPLLEQIILLYQYFITQQVSAYRVSCKMNSILLNLFIELVSKVSWIKSLFDFDEI